MYLPKFDHSKMEWDAWQAFHIKHGHHKFVQFDTGEFIVCNRRWPPDARHIYKDLHLQVVATDDHDCPHLFVPGATKPVPKSHLNHKGQQILLLDHDHKRAVSLDGGLSEDSGSGLIPARFAGDRTYRTVTAYYSGPNAMPYGAAAITRHYPQPLTHAQRKHVSELHDACKVWLQMQPDPDALRREHFHIEAPKVANFVDTPFSALATSQRVTLAQRGFNMILREENRWLTFNE